MVDEVLVVQWHGAEIERWPVIAKTGDDVSVLSATTGDFDEIARHARLALLRLGDGTIRTSGDEGVLEELDEGSRLFVAAWRSRSVTKPDRPGDGLSWDAPGFLPPDPPAG